MINFGCSRHELCLRYRLGLERALAKADFLNAPDIALVQAFAIFICLARRHESPRYVWMMTGLVIRMAQYLGLQRDGDQLGQLTPFEIEMRRRVWWGLCMLDLRTSEDQGTDLTIAQGSFDTKMPSNINDADIGPKSASMPPGREGVTDLSFSRISAGVTALMRQMVDPRTRRDVAGLEDQSRLLNEIHQKFESEYLQHATESGNIAYWVISSVARLIMAKMTLIVFLPVLFSPTAERVSEEIRTKLLVSAIEVAEYNHALNAEQACRHWRWVYQTHTHWHAIVYLLIEVARRPWSPMIERAWVALHSSWLIPAHVRKDKNSRIWVPLRKLMDKARLHRESELNRLQADPQAAAMLELEDYNLPLPSSPGPFPNGASSEVFRDRWRQLVAVPEAFGSGTHIHGIPAADAMKPSTNITYASQLNARSVPAPTEVVTTSNMTFDHGYLQTSGQQISEVHGLDNTTSLDTVIGSEPAPASGSGQTTGASYMSFPTVTADWSDVRTMGPGFTPWLWVDGEPSVEAFSGNVGPVDANVDLDIDVNWYEWVKTAKDME